jgi:hypothetical protein
MKRVKLFLKSGNIMEFTCKDITVRTDSFGDVQGLEVTDSDVNYLVVKISQIEGVLVWQ